MEDISSITKTPKKLGGQLTKPFGQNYPEELEATLDCGHYAICCRFNRWGSLLAVGCNDGHLVIYDFVTRCPMKNYTPHLSAICAISWSRDGRKILTAGAEKTVVLTDVLSGDSEGHFAFSSTVACLQINPRRRSQFLICQVKQQAMLMNIDGQRTIIHDDSENGVEANIVASFDKRGDYIISGTVKGKVTIHDVNTLQLLAYFRQPGGYCIRSLEVARRGSLFMTNSNDRVIRVYDLNDVKNGGKDSSVLPIQKVQDSVNRTSWKVCCFSGDSEYICAGSSGTHALYIWERSSGSVVKFLHGSKGEQVLDMVWHPVRTAVFSVSNGKLALWSHCRSENWSAFAPDFKELAENVEYEERESEFDLEDEDKSPPNLEVSLESAIKDGSVEVDIESVDYMRTFFSSDDDEDPLRLICCMPEIEDPEESVSEVLTEHPEAHMPRSSNAVNVSSFPFRIDLPAFSYAIPTNSDSMTTSSGDRLGQPKAKKRNATKN
ncbi:WD domain, G-beta repeat protein [Trichuris suis]|nr:WD domain, G-beta repeat protein [Trichuris suis]